MILVLAAAAGVCLFVWFLSLETRRRPEVAVFLLIGATLLDAVLYPSQTSVPLGPFRPSIAGQDIRIVDVIVPTALAARLIVRGLPRRVSAEGLAWTLFFAWYTFSALLGYVRGQPIDLILFQGKFVLHTGGVMAVVAGVPLAKLANRATLDRIAIAVGWPTLLVLPLAAAGLSFDVPVLAGAQIGRFAPDAATMLTVLGMLTLFAQATGSSSPAARIGSVAMIGTAFVADQRALLVGLVPALLVLAVAMGGPVWRRRTTVRVGGIVPFVGLLFVPVAIGIASSAESGQGLEAVPVVGSFDETFSSEAKAESASIRIDLLYKGRQLAVDRMVLGHGLGEQTAVMRGSKGIETLIADFHNIIVDLAVRGGLGAVALFLIGLGLTLRGAAVRWGRLVHDVHAFVTLAASAALCALIVKGMFETVFQKYRLAVFVGLLLGLIAAAGAAPMTTRADARPRREATWT